MPIALKNVLELSKQLQALVPFGLAYPTSNFVPFLNPQIAEDLSLITGLLALIASAITYNLAQYGGNPNLAWRLCCFGLFVVGGSLVAMLFLAENVLLSNYPSEQFIAAELAFVGFFFGIGFAAGWCSARILRATANASSD
jgi:hypothetical protein